MYSTHKFNQHIGGCWLILDWNTSSTWTWARSSMLNCSRKYLLIMQQPRSLQSKNFVLVKEASQVVDVKNIKHIVESQRLIGDVVEKTAAIGNPRKSYYINKQDYVILLLQCLHTRKRVKIPEETTNEKQQFLMI